MKIESLKVRNYKAVHSAELVALGNLVVIAGQNGSGKSCLFDAIRLLKSVYGGYQNNEFQQWLGEMQIDFRDPKSVLSIFNDKKEKLILEMTVKLHEDERKYLLQNAKELVAIGQQTDAPWGLGDMRSNYITVQMKQHLGTIKKHIAQAEKILVKELKKKTLVARLTIQPGEIPVPHVEPSMALGVLFSNFVPRHLGVIDFHGPHRVYERERLNSINVNLQSLEDQRRNSLLYNFNQKYVNVKNEMAAIRLRELLAGAAGSNTNTHHDLIKTLQDLFVTFFPGKEFLGPQPTPDGALSFPVKVGDGILHDLDELSAGEKEILYGYLRLRNSAPKNCVILIDEPELHLNPRLTRKLPDFYYRNLASNLDNQVWLVTHSDALLRDVLGRAGYSVFHMVSTETAEKKNHAKPIVVDEDLDRAIVDLVGDLAAYSPDAKTVIFEGDIDSEFDVRMTSELFPEFASQVNCVSGTNKARVKGLYTILAHLHKKGALKTQVFAITDSDSEFGSSPGTTEFSWDVYHIENYLLEPKFVAMAMNDVLGPQSKIKAEDVASDLKKCASEVVSALTRGSVGHKLNKELVSAINTKIDPNSNDMAGDLSRALSHSLKRFETIATKTYTKAEIGKLIEGQSSSFQKDLKTGDWRKTFRGRDILKRYVDLRGKGQVNYQTFRNLVLARMRDGRYKPSGMQAVLDRILK